MPVKKRDQTSTLNSKGRASEANEREHSYLWVYLSKVLLFRKVQPQARVWGAKNEMAKKVEKLKTLTAFRLKRGDRD